MDANYIIVSVELTCLKCKVILSDMGPFLFGMITESDKRISKKLASILAAARFSGRRLFKATRPHMDIHHRVQA